MLLFFYLATAQRPQHGNHRILPDFVVFHDLVPGIAQKPFWVKKLMILLIFSIILILENYSLVVCLEGQLTFYTLSDSIQCFTPHKFLGQPQ